MKLSYTLLFAAVAWAEKGRAQDPQGTPDGPPDAPPDEPYPIPDETPDAPPDGPPDGHIPDFASDCATVEDEVTGCLGNGLGECMTCLDVDPIEMRRMIEVEGPEAALMQFETMLEGCSDEGKCDWDCGVELEDSFGCSMYDAMREGGEMTPDVDPAAPAGPDGRPGEELCLDERSGVEECLADNGDEGECMGCLSLALQDGEIEDMIENMDAEDEVDRIETLLLGCDACANCAPDLGEFFYCTIEAMRDGQLPVPGGAGGGGGRGPPVPTDGEEGEGEGEVPVPGGANGGSGQEPSARTDGEEGEGDVPMPDGADGGNAEGPEEPPARTDGEGGEGEAPMPDGAGGGDGQEPPAPIDGEEGEGEGGEEGEGGGEGDEGEEGEEPPIIAKTE